MGKLAHGMRNTPTYKAWEMMKARCNNPNTHEFDNYGGRGITYSKNWETFVGFFADMGERPKGLTLDRIDFNGPYSKENCRWATMKTQQRNRRNNHLLTWGRETFPISQWAEIKNLPATALYKRIEAGWSIEDALNRPLRPLRPQPASSSSESLPS